MTARGDASPADLSRRSFLGRGAATGLGVLLIGSADAVFGARPALAAGYGPLVADPRRVLGLPAGFGYRVVAQVGVTRLTTGQPTPAAPDGTACFPRPGGGSVLVVNHEVGGAERNRVPAIPGYTYDSGAGGGTTTLEVDAQGDRVREYVSLAGTYRNCAGGVTPWGTWLSCEETEAVAGGALRRRHGYVFEVDPLDQQANRDPRPVRALGRFAHEAVAVDPATSRMYLTEDASGPNGLLYRWTPPSDRVPLGKGSLRALGATEGALEAMRALSGTRHVADLSEATAVGTSYRVEWVAVPDRDARSTATRRQAYARPVTRGRKLEGMWWGDGGAYVVSSYARRSEGQDTDHDGQVWFLDPRARTITLRLRFACTRADGDVDGPDNITVSPYGGVIVAEDGAGRQHLVGATPSGQTYLFARNEASTAEFTGPAFSADRRFLFANIQGDGGPEDPGYVLAITGPFRTQA
ncbi:alkaline phosphatase PhoX [Blastococcus sp. SYSU D00669]